MRPPFALCAGCCRVHPIADLIPDELMPPGLCPSCGDQTCDATCCTITGMQQLAAGDWSGMQPWAAKRAVSWTPDGGLVLRPPADDEEAREEAVARAAADATWPDPKYLRLRAALRDR